MCTMVHIAGVQAMTDDQPGPNSIVRPVRSFSVIGQWELVTHQWESQNPSPKAARARVRHWQAISFFPIQQLMERGSAGGKQGRHPCDIAV